LKSGKGFMDARVKPAHDAQYVAAIEASWFRPHQTSRSLNNVGDYWIIRFRDDDS
jgi:hypothetical protein